MTASHELAALGGHSAEHQSMMLWTALGVFVAVVAVLVVLHRQSKESAEMEDIDQLLRDEDVL